MATTEQYLAQLQTDKETLVNNLVEKGVEATNEETFTSLVPKVLDIQSGGEGLTPVEESYKNFLQRIAIDTLLIPEGTSRIGYYAFYQYTNTIKEIILPSSVIAVWSYAFQQATGIKKVVVLANTISFWKDSFRQSGITELHIYSETASFGDFSFYSANSLTKIVFYNLTKVPTLSNSLIISNGSNCEIFVPDDLVTSFQNANYWNNGTIKPLSEYVE